MALTEADTCRRYITPALVAAGWDTHEQIAEQRYFTDGRIVVLGRTTKRNQGKKADYILRHTRDVPIAVVEAKAFDVPATDGVQQALDYARILGVPFAYATNGQDIIEHDFLTGTETHMTSFPAPADLWARWKLGRKLDAPVEKALLTPYFLDAQRSPRYYQTIAIDRATAALAGGRERVLLTLATGTGKSFIAFQVCYRLWQARWNRKGSPHRPKILYLADRNILVDQPMLGVFAPFGDALHRIEGEAVKSREMYFATYQAIAKDERRPGLYREYAPDFFDLVVVDECHRGSARDDSNWREILDHFTGAAKLGMTATPLREDNRDTYEYFGNPVYQYSLAQGIEDGFLAPYKVRRVVTDVDAAGWRPDKGQRDRLGREVPDEEYRTRDFERRIVLPERTKALARYITDYLVETDPFGKTIVFCVDQDHAARMREALIAANGPRVRQYPDYVVRVGDGADAVLVGGVVRNRIALRFSLESLFRQAERPTGDTPDPTVPVVNVAHQVFDAIFSQALPIAARNVREHDWKSEADSYVRMKLDVLDRSTRTWREELSRNDRSIDEKTWEIMGLVTRNERLREALAGFQDTTRMQLRRKAVEEHGEMIKMLGAGAIRALHCDGGHVDFETGKVDIEYDDYVYVLGPFRIELDLGEGTVRITGISGAPKVDGYYHPHVASGGTPCLGNMAPVIAKTMGAGDVVGAIGTVLEFMRSYNHGNGYVDLMRWNPDYEDDGDRFESCYENSACHDCVVCGDDACPYRDGAEHRCWENHDTGDCIDCGDCSYRETAVQNCREEHECWECTECSRSCPYAGDLSECHEQDRCGDCPLSDCRHHPDRTKENDDAPEGHEGQAAQEAP